MKNKKEIKKYVWTCDFCGKEFKTKNESDQHELNCKKRFPFKNNNLIIIVIVIVSILLLSVGYLFGKNQELQQRIKNDPSPTPYLEPTKVLAPTTKPTVKTQNTVPTKQVNTPTPENKKVPVSISEVGLSGTYYCFENKANILAQKQNDLNNLHKLVDFCVNEYSNKIKNCNYNDPSSNCPTGDECNSKSNDVINAQNELGNLIKNYCP